MVSYQLVNGKTSAMVNANLEMVVPAAAVSVDLNHCSVVVEGQKAPQWFLNHCVKTAEELRGQRRLLRICGDSIEASKTEEDAELYEVDFIVYNQLRAVRHLVNSALATHAPPFIFEYDTIYLRYPDREHTHAGYCPPPPPPPRPPGMHHTTSPPSPLTIDGSQRFFSLIVEQFVEDSGANLITLALDDLKDLSGHFAKVQGVAQFSYVTDYRLVQRYFDQDKPAMMAPLTAPGGPIPWMSPPRRTVRRPVVWPVCENCNPVIPPFPLNAILSAPLLTKPVEPTSDVERTPLIIHIPEIQKLLREIGGNILGAIKELLRNYRQQNSNVLVIFSDPAHGIASPWTEYSVLSSTGTRPMPAPITVVPRNTPAQISLFVKHQLAEHSLRPSNIRELQYALRTTHPNASDMPNLLPYASWEFLGNDESLKRLDKFELGDSDLYELVREIGECYEAEHIRETIVAFYRSKEAFEPWWGAVREKHDRDNRQEV